ncbi:hypothetical protein L7F22_055664 [Adiantum nelumboides]|nr:hypothetical protein [Adiantum nelumboides]
MSALVFCVLVLKCMAMLGLRFYCKLSGEGFLPGGTDASDRALLIDVMFWTMKHSPPAHILLITGDSDFAVLMNKLRLLGYNVLLAAFNKAGMSSALVHAASKIWVWPDIIVGEPEGLMGETHIPGTPLPEKLVNKRKESEASKSSMDLHEDSGHEFMKDVLGEIGRVKLRDGGWLPPSVVDRIVNIVKDRPGISLGELIKELKAMSFNPKQYGYYDYHHCLSRIEHLEFQYIDGMGPKRGVILNISKHAAHKKIDVLPKQDSCVSCRNSDHKEATGEDQSKIQKSTGELLYGKSSTGIAQRSWGSRLLSFFKGS